MVDCVKGFDTVDHAGHSKAEGCPDRLCHRYDVLVDHVKDRRKSWLTVSKAGVCPGRLCQRQEVEDFFL